MTAQPSPGAAGAAGGRAAAAPASAAATSQGVLGAAQDKALEIYQKLKDSTSITVDIQRRGRAMTMNYGIGR